MLNSNGKVSLDELLADPGRARALPRSVRADLLARCAAVIVTLSSTEEESSQQTTAIRSADDVRLPATMNGSSPPSTGSDYLTAKQVAECLGVKESWIMSEARASRIPKRMVGRYVRFVLGEVQRAVEERQT